MSAKLSLMFFVVCCVLGTWAADPQGSPPPRSKRAKSPAPKATESRPAIRRSGALASASSDDSAATEMDVDDPDGPAADGQGRSGMAALVQQVVMLAILILGRLALAFFKAHPPGEDSPLAQVGKSLRESAMLGPAFSLIGTIQSRFAEFVRSPSSAPVMIGLLILATKLVARSDSAADGMFKEAEESTEDEGAETSAMGALDDDDDSMQVEEAEGWEDEDGIEQTSASEDNKGVCNDDLVDDLAVESEDEQEYDLVADIVGSTSSENTEAEAVGGGQIDDSQAEDDDTDCADDTTEDIYS